MLRELRRRVDSITARHGVNDFASDIRIARTWSDTEEEYPDRPANVYGIIFLDANSKRTEHSSKVKTAAYYLGNSNCYIERGTTVSVVFINSQWWIVQCHTTLTEGKPPDPPNPPDPGDDFPSSAFGSPCYILSAHWETEGALVGPSFSDPDVVLERMPFGAGAGTIDDRIGVRGPIQLEGIQAIDGKVIPDEVKARSISFSFGKDTRDSNITVIIEFGHLELRIHWYDDIITVTDPVTTTRIGTFTPESGWVSGCVSWTETEHTWMVNFDSRTQAVGSPNGNNGFSVSSAEGGMDSWHVFDDADDCGCGGPEAACYAFWCNAQPTNAIVDMGDLNWEDEDWNVFVPLGDPVRMGASECDRVGGEYVIPFVSSEPSLRNCLYERFFSGFTARSPGNFLVRGNVVDEAEIRFNVRAGRDVDIFGNGVGNRPPPTPGSIRISVYVTTGSRAPYFGEEAKAYYEVEVPPNVTICNSTISLPLTYFSNHPSEPYYSNVSVANGFDFSPTDEGDPGHHTCDHSFWPESITVRFSI